MCDTSNFQVSYNRTEGMFKVKIGNKEKLGLIAELLLMHSMRCFYKFKCYRYILYRPKTDFCVRYRTTWYIVGPRDELHCGVVGQVLEQ